MRRVFACVSLGLLVGGCSSSAMTDTAMPSGAGDPSGAASPTMGGASAVPSSSDAGSVSVSGVLTAGAWDDNRNFDFFSGYLDGKKTLTGAPPLASGDRASAFSLFAGARAPRQRLDVAIVIDTTGSMGDEARYVKGEFASIASAIQAEYPNADQRWALVAYRDRPDTDPNDGYVTKSWDFGGDFQAALNSLDVGNGGDYQEAPELGLAAMSSLAWRPDSDVARIAFWIADAPQHDNRGPDMVQAFGSTRAKDIHLYPVAASGTDDLLELTMRSGAQLTGGRYLFLTNDSGIGDPHKEPEIPCYFVTKLADAIVRMVAIELSGTYREPLANQILRTGGSPTNGRCTLTGGQQVSVF